MASELINIALPALTGAVRPNVKEAGPDFVSISSSKAGWEQCLSPHFVHPTKEKKLPRKPRICLLVWYIDMWPSPSRDFSLKTDITRFSIILAPERSH